MKDNISKKKIRAFYGVKNRIGTAMHYTPLVENSSTLWRTITLLSAYFISSLKILFKEVFSKNKVFIISRDVKILIPAILVKSIFRSLFRAKIVYMAPEVKNGKIFKWVLKRCDGVIAGTTLTKDSIRKIVPISEEKFTLSLAPVPVYENDCSKEEARKRIGYTSTSPLVVYTGKLGLDVQEVIYTLQTAKLLPEYTFLFTGGRPSSVAAVKAYCTEHQIQNILLTGFLDDSTRIRDYQLAADVLISYYTSNDHLVEFNYPQKVNEYLSTKNPVVTPDFPATRDVLNDKNVIFVKPNDPVAFAEGIKKAVKEKDYSRKIAEQAYKDIQPLAFPTRAKIWLDFLTKLK